MQQGLFPVTKGWFRHSQSLCLLSVCHSPCCVTLVFSCHYTILQMFTAEKLWAFPPLLEVKPLPSTKRGNCCSDSQLETHLVFTRSDGSTKHKAYTEESAAMKQWNQHWLDMKVFVWWEKTTEQAVNPLVIFWLKDKFSTFKDKNICCYWKENFRTFSKLSCS